VKREMLELGIVKSGRERRNNGQKVGPKKKKCTGSGKRVVVWENLDVLARKIQGSLPKEEGEPTGTGAKQNLRRNSSLGRVLNGGDPTWKEGTRPNWTLGAGRTTRKH